MPLNHETQYLQVRRVEVILKALLHKSTLTQFNGDISSKSVFKGIVHNFFLCRSNLIFWTQGDLDSQRKGP